nr:ribonuclease H-like domain, reverse transcriptase, RNA-dependent DNA polymerase [Tanacetum cinerariifolium]
IGHNYSVKAAAAPIYSAFVGASSFGSKPGYSDQQSIVTIVLQTSGHSDNIMKCVLHSFVAKNDRDQDMIYEDFDQVDQIEMEELDLKWQLAILSLRINRLGILRIRSQKTVDHEAENKTGVVEKVYGMMAGLNEDHAAKGAASVSDAADEFAVMGISPQV